MKKLPAISEFNFLKMRVQQAKINGYTFLASQFFFNLMSMQTNFLRYTTRVSTQTPG
jgi:hypothetical protein